MKSIQRFFANSSSLFLTTKSQNHFSPLFLRVQIRPTPLLFCRADRYLISSEAKHKIRFISPWIPFFRIFQGKKSYQKLNCTIYCLLLWTRIIGFKIQMSMQTWDIGINYGTSIPEVLNRERRSYDFWQSLNK